MKKIKILAVTDAVGSNYHRIQIPISYMNKEKFEITERPLNKGFIVDEEVKDIDILYFHWSLPNHSFSLAFLQKKYNFKIVMDIDDHWGVSSGHPSYRDINNYIPILKNLLIVSDYIICTTEYLKSKLLEYNDNVIVIPNRLPYGEDQFTIEPVKQRDKIRVGFIGSISHHPDWKLLKNEMKRILADKKITDNCEFVVCGYNDLNEYSKKLWLEIFDVFQKKGKIFRTRDIHTYMYLYNEADVVLSPLVDTEQNRAKSELKVLETACKGAIVLGSKLYRDKLIDPSVMLMDDEMSYYKWLRKLVDMKDLRTYIQNNCNKVIETYPFKPIIEARENLFEHGL
jgi:hypothetical protein